MVNPSERSLAHGLGLAGGLLVMVGGVVALAYGVADAVGGHLFGAVASVGAAVALGVIGGLAVLFAHLSNRGWSERPGSAGILLVVLAVLAWLVSAPGVNIATLVGGILVLVAGVLLLIEPATRVVAKAVAPT